MLGWVRYTEYTVNERIKRAVFVSARPATRLTGYALALAASAFAGHMAHRIRARRCPCAMPHLGSRFYLSRCATPGVAGSPGCTRGHADLHVHPHAVIAVHSAQWQWSEHTGLGCPQRKQI